MDRRRPSRRVGGYRRTANNESRSTYRACRMMRVSGTRCAATGRIENKLHWSLGGRATCDGSRRPQRLGLNRTSPCCGPAAEGSLLKSDKTPPNQPRKPSRAAGKIRGNAYLLKVLAQSGDAIALTLEPEIDTIDRDRVESAIALKGSSTGATGCQRVGGGGKPTLGASRTRP